MKKPQPLLHRLFLAARAAPNASPPEPPAAPPGFADRVLQRRRQTEPPAPPAFAILLRNLSLGAAAAALCLALGVGFILRPSEAGTPDDELALQSQLESWVTLL